MGQNRLMAHPRLRVPVNCSTCNKTFEVPPSRMKASKRLFCSMECRNVGLHAPRPKRVERVTVQCACCGKDKEVTASYVERNKSGTFFCSLDCRDDYDIPIPRPSWQASRTLVSCSQCGAEVSLTPVRFARNTTGLFFCNNTCQLAHGGANPKRLPDRTCEICSATFHSTDHTARFCSKECYDAWQSRRGTFYPCAVCGKEMRRPPSQSHIKTCSQECRGISKIKRAIPGRWHNGKPARHTVGGYVMVYEPDHPDAHARSGWILEHRLVASQMVGRRLREDEQVHHVNGQKDCNDPSNLQIIDGSEHSQITVAEGSQRRRAAQRRIRELEASEARMRAEQERTATELAELRKRLE